MELTLIRHGQSANNANGDEQRHNDPELTPLGWTQARRLADYLKDSENTEDVVRLRSHDPSRLDRHPNGFDQIYVSPMHRALQTAQPIAEALGSNVRVWPELHESGGIYKQTPEGTMVFGGLTHAEIAAGFPTYDVPDSVTDAGWYDTALGEEDIYGCYARAMRVAKTLRKMSMDEQNKHRRIGIVSHGNFIVALINALSDRLPSEGLYYWHYNTGSTRMDFMDNGMIIIRYVNRCMHLPAHWVT